MSERLITKYILDGLSGSEDSALAFADGSRKITWYNRGFKTKSGQNKIKGRNFLNLFHLQLNKDVPAPTFKRPSVYKVPGYDFSLKVSVLGEKGKTNGFLIELLPETHHENGGNRILNKNITFQKDLQEILDSLIKEISIHSLSEEILGRAVSISESSFGMIVFYQDKNKQDFIFFDPSSLIKDQDGIKKEFKASSSYIDKWLLVNKRSLMVLNHPNNIGYNLTNSLACESLIISPCLFDNKLAAAIIVGKKDSIYPALEINNIDQFSSLLSFAINSIKTRDLNAALEVRLLQAQKLETIGKLASGMAHDFSNLLSSIFGSLNLLKKRIPEREDIYRLLDNIENCSVRAKDLTKGLLSFGKPTPKRKELIKPNDLLNEISKVITQTFPAKIKFEKEIEDPLYDILGNGTEIYQVLLNLCVNAKESIEGSGKIALKARNITINESNIVNHPLLDKGNYVWLSVTDTGTGIEEDNLIKIFDPYFSTKNKASGSGSGLGLYVTYGIIKAHKGNIEVSSQLNKGTTFDVFIPAYEPTLAGKQSPGQKIILLADDELMLRDLLAELLESTGYNVIKVSTGTEALKVLTEEIKVDMVIVDYNMPGMDGLECTRKIRELNLDMPIILSTGSLSFEGNSNYSNPGVTSILAKPYEFETMLSTIKQLL